MEYKTHSSFKWFEGQIWKPSTPLFSHGRNPLKELVYLVHKQPTVSKLTTNFLIHFSGLFLRLNNQRHSGNFFTQIKKSENFLSPILTTSLTQENEYLNEEYSYYNH